MADVRPSLAGERPRAGGMAVQAIDIQEVGAGGAGVGRLADGRIVFIHGTAPGEQVAAEVTELKKDWARARLKEVLRPGPARRVPPCPHSGACGGCTLQHLQYDAQLAAKAGIVTRALRRIGHLEWVTPEVEPSPLEFGYRNRVSFSLLRLGSSRVVAGFHALERPGRIVDVGGECLLPESAISRVWAGLRREWGRNAERLPAGRQLRLTLRGSERGEVTLLVEGGHGTGRAAELVERVPGLVAIWQRPGTGRPPRILAGAASLMENWNHEEADITPAAFLQVNRHAGALLDDWIVQRVGPAAGLRIIDAYCGIGVHGRRLARLGAAVTAIELDPDAAAEARRLAGASVEVLQGRVEDLLPRALPADVVIVNPPRTGLDAAVSRQLSENPPGRVLYVSCDPATLARDLGRVRDRLRLSAVRCFDLFPQTAHVETVAELECATS